MAIADSWEELAGKIGVPIRRRCRPPSTATTTCATRAATPTSSSRPQLLRPLSTPPFYAVLGVRFCHGTEGGAKINERMEVTKRDGGPVAGLYATGDNTSGWVVHWGLPGTTLAFAFTSGYIAAESAAAYTG